MRRLRLLLWALLATALSTPAAAQPRPPLLLAHYMAWYQARPYAASWGWHWTMNRFNPDVQTGGRRQIASHLYPAIGPYDSRDADVAEYHVLLMKVSGLDGLVVDWYGASNVYDYPLIHEATARVIEAARRVGLRVAICYEDRTIQARIDAGRLAPADAVAAARADLDHARVRWMGDPSYLTLDGRPVVLAFGPVRFRTSAEWAAVFREYPVAPQFFPQDHRLAPVAAGAFPWPPMWASGGGTLSPSRLAEYLESFYGTAAAWPAVVAGAFPGFHDIYAEAGLHASYGYLDDRGGATFRETLDRALRSGAPLVQIATWNDFGEGTVIEPTLERGTRELGHLRDVVAASRPHPYGPDDLALPRAVYDARKRHAGDAAARARIDAAVAHLVAGDVAEARRALAAVATDAEAAPARAPQVALRLAGTAAGAPLRIDLDLAAGGAVRVAVHDVLGREVARPVDGALGAGAHAAWLDTGALAPGVYVVRLQAAGQAVSRAFVRMR